jgi:anti-anti-sigma factor
MIADEPVLALCAYDRRQLGAEVLAGLHSLHPLHHHDADIDFAVYADSGGSVVAGEIDAASFDRFDLALEALLEDERSEVVLDLARLQFIDVAGLRAIAATGERLHGQGRALVLRAANPLVARCWHLLEFDRLGGVRLEPSR